MGWGADMTKQSGTNDKSATLNDNSLNDKSLHDNSLNDNFMAEDTDSSDLDGNEEALPPRVNHKDPTVRRKIEDRLERKRLREELGIYDDDAWKDI